MVFSQLNVKASAITGGVLGFLCWILGLGMGFGAMPMYGFASGMMAGYMMGYYGFAGVYIITLIITGALLGAAVAFVYNWALKLK